MRSRTMTRTRRRFGRKRRGRRRDYRGRVGMPFKIVRRVKTCVHYPFDPGAGTIAVGLLNLNSAQDPTGNVGTGQPLAHDQYSGLYERCAVIGGTVQIECTSVDGTNPIAVGINVQPSSTTLTTYEHYKEMPHTSFRIMTPDMDKVSFGVRYGVGKYFGHRKILSDDRLNAAIGAEPTDLLYGHLFFQALDKTANAGLVQTVITITQTIIYFKPKTPARS